MEHLEVDGIGPVSRIGLGTWQFGSREWGYGDAYASGGARDIVRRALELGVTLFDTAEAYGFGKSEKILGDALGAERIGVVVATKLFPVAPFPPLVKRSVAASAQRLGLSRIPLYQVHQPNPVVPDTVPMPVLRALRDAGKLGAVGVSNYSLERWRKADDAFGGPVVSNQVQFSLAHTGTARRPGAVRRTGEPAGHRLQPARAGTARRPVRPRPPPGGVRAINPLFGRQNLERVAPLLDLLREVAAGHDSTPSQVALAWLVAQPRTVVIPGASSVQQLESNVAAADLDLAADEVEALTAAARRFQPVSGVSTLVDEVRTRVGELRSRL